MFSTISNSQQSLLMSNDGLKKKGTMMKFDVVSRAMKAEKSAKKCAVRPELLFCLLSCRSVSWLPEIAGSTRKQFGFSTKSLQCDDFVKKPSI